jgi:secreted trypsin-like serine protease
MRVRVVALSLLVPLAAVAGPVESPIIGGTDAPFGKWPDVAAVYLSDNTQECTATLVAPTLVLTAGHCVIDLQGETIKSVLIGTNSLIKKIEGEVINVKQVIEYPSSQRSFDAAVLVLEKASTREPRKLATGWASLDIKNGATAHIVGYGAVDRSGPVRYGDDEEYVNELQEASVMIVDADCSKHPDDCEPAAMPAGELAAGGVGMPDTCPGDSGGPIYLPTDYGTFLAGITSRGYEANIYWCSEGGLYVRTDKLADWIEKSTSLDVARGPEPTVPDKLTAVRGHLAEAQIDANDPKSTEHDFAIKTAPKYATAAVSDGGHLRVCTDPGVVAMDTLELTITDKNDSTRVLTYTIPVEITDGDAGGGCDADDFDSGGCCDSGRSAGGSIPLALGVLAVLRARHRRNAVERE